MINKLRLLLLILLVASPLIGAKWEKEQIAYENQLTQRIEGILSKTLPPNSYLVTVKVEMTADGAGGVERRTNTRGGGNPFLEKSRFVLPGVPEKKQFSASTSVTEESTVVNQPVEALVKKISISILVAPDVTKEQIRSLREFISSTIPFNPLRGDELDIQNSPLLKPIGKPDLPNLTGTASPPSTTDRLLGSSNLPVLILLAVVALGLFGLAAFLFGPVRAFFNRLLAVLPRVGEQAIYAANANPPAAPAVAAATPQTAYPTMGYQGNGDTGPKLNMPFQFIREEQLDKLGMLFRELASSEAALILAYLPPLWASRLLSSFDATTQGAIARELSKSHEVPADVVKQVEDRIREKLPYLVGGKEWIQAVFPLTHPQTQRVLLNTLSQESPEIAKSLRQKTFFYEDLANLAPPALRALVQEIGYPQLALALKDEKKDLLDAVLRRLPAGIRTIVQQELELSNGDKLAIADAKNRLVAAARKLLADGRMTLGGAA